MPEWKIGRMLIIGGVMMLVLGVGALPARGAAPALPLPQPSPRPTLLPTATPLVPTPTQTGSSGDSDPQPAEAPGAAGRITGTIIDLDTGAPMPGMTVNVGGVLVTSDANGNYDHWLPVGAYSVTLILTQAQGEPAQPPQTAHLAPGGTVVLHLSYRSPPPVSATPEPAGSAPVQPPSTKLRPGFPTRLPVTGEQPSSAWLWMALGVMLLMGGGALELRRMRSRSPLLVGARRPVAAPRPSPRMQAGAAPTSGYENAVLLATLLASSVHAAPTRAAPGDDELLAALLDADTQESNPGPGQRGFIARR